MFFQLLGGLWLLYDCWGLHPLCCLKPPCPLTIHLCFTSFHISAGVSRKSVLRTLCRSAQSWAAVSLWESSSVGVLGARAAVIHRPIEMDRVVLMEAKYIQNPNPSQNISVNSLVPPIYLLCSSGDRVNTHYSGTSLQSVIHGSWHWPLFTLHPPLITRWFWRDPLYSKVGHGLAKNCLCFSHSFSCEIVCSWHRDMHQGVNQNSDLVLTLKKCILSISKPREADIFLP